MIDPYNLEIFKTKKLIAFDVDGTLTQPKGLIDEEMTTLLKELLKIRKMAIITGEAFINIENQILTKLNLTKDHGQNLTLLPTNGGSIYTFDNKWVGTLLCKLTDEEKKEIITAINQVDQQSEELRDNKSYGLEIQDRNSQITYSAYGDKAPLELKLAWDNDFHKRMALQKSLQEKLPNFEVKIGGTTSIDITPPGLNKTYGINKIMSFLKLNKEEILYVGDSVYEKGNDFPVFQMGIDTVKVANPDETKIAIKNMLKEEQT